MAFRKKHADLPIEAFMSMGALSGSDFAGDPRSVALFLCIAMPK
jgi:hypothetical protein